MTMRETIRGQVTLEDGTTVTLRRNARARRISLRVSRRDGAVTLTLPPRLPESEALEFLHDRRDWLARALAGITPPERAIFGAALPVEGRALVLTPAPVRRPVIEGEALLLPASRPAGPAAAGFLKALAHARLTEASDRHADALGRRFTALAVRDTRSRWGSCTHDGRLMYSWRLAMAPPEVLDYVAAHEVAHLAHMDHSPRFWAAVRGLKPDYATHRGWLRERGSALQGWQFRAPKDDCPKGD